MRFILMHKKIPVLHMEIDESTGVISSIYDLHSPKHLPISVSCIEGVLDRKALNAWWTGRSIPDNRYGLRDALEIMQISAPQLLLTKSYGLSLSDQYWVRPEGSGLCWEDINFFKHPFSDDMGNILFGEIPHNETINFISPDNTSEGWLKKKWVIMHGDRCLIKGGSGTTRQEPYNEVLASRIMDRLGILHTPYTLTEHNKNPYCICKDFITAETELISAWHIIQTQKRPNHVSVYQHYLNCCESLSIPDIRNTVDQMLSIDYIIVNEDRHLNNFGAIRNADTLEWVGPAPTFDCGTSLWYSTPATLIDPSKKQPSKPFRAEHSTQIELVKSYEWLDFSSLQGIDNEFYEILKDSIFIDEYRRSVLCNSLRKRVELLNEYLTTRNHLEFYMK